MPGHDTSATLIEIAIMSPSGAHIFMMISIQTVRCAASRFYAAPIILIVILKRAHNTNTHTHERRHPIERNIEFESWQTHTHTRPLNCGANEHLCIVCGVCWCAGVYVNRFQNLTPWLNCKHQRQTSCWIHCCRCGFVVGPRAQLIF